MELAFLALFAAFSCCTQESYCRRANHHKILRGSALRKLHHGSVINKTSLDELSIDQPKASALLGEHGGSVGNVTNVRRSSGKTMEKHSKSIHVHSIGKSDRMGKRRKIKRNVSNAVKSDSESEEKHGSQGQQSSLRGQHHLSSQLRSHKSIDLMSDVLACLQAQPGIVYWVAGVVLLCCCSCCCLAELFLRKRDQLSRVDRMENAENITYNEDGSEAESWFTRTISKGKRARGETGSGHYQNW